MPGKDSASGPQYEERYCAFVDILGFQQIISSLRDGVPFQKVRYILQAIHTPKSGVALDVYEADFRAQSISDAVAISTRACIAGAFQIYKAIEDLAWELLVAEGLFIRGAVTKGLLYHDERTVFGEGLIRAYNLEREIVRYPRVMVTSDVLGAFGGDPDVIHQAEDGPMFFHVLRRLRYTTIDDHRDAPALPDSSEYCKARWRIQRNFNMAIDNPRHFEKVKWFATYWNNSLPDECRSIARIKGTGLDPKPAYYG